ncbi:MAG TPA: hypothetical protein VGQ72_01805 [Pyrinomonadaceae bacterium]|jgi:hypothetical protein|nr:hypothetical protein [Pyrinomonadaceae bacterium]
MSALLEKVVISGAEDEFVRRARELYDQKLRVVLEPNQQGRYVAIEPDTGRYFLGDTGTAALVEAHTSMPKHSFYLARIGYEAADSLHGHGNRVR